MCGGGHFHSFLVLTCRCQCCVLSQCTHWGTHRRGMHLETCASLIWLMPSALSCTRLACKTQHHDWEKHAAHRIALAPSWAPTNAEHCCLLQLTGA